MINLILKNLHTIGAVVGTAVMLTVCANLFFVQLAEYGWGVVK